MLENPIVDEQDGPPTPEKAQRAMMHSTLDFKHSQGENMIVKDLNEEDDAVSDQDAQ